VRIRNDRKKKNCGWLFAYMGAVLDGKRDDIEGGRGAKVEFPQGCLQRCNEREGIRRACNVNKCSGEKKGGD